MKESNTKADGNDANITTIPADGADRVSELQRLLDEETASLAAAPGSLTRHGSTPENDVTIVPVAQQTSHDALSILQAQLADAKERENRLLGIVESQARLLEYMPKPAETVVRSNNELTMTVWVTIIGVVGVVGVLAVALWLVR